uniref:Uncharacterized protein n=1 Tax=Phlebotomus papatasi TaxID=29031 RepID=A0A1B0DCD4_PHLPP
MGNNCCTKRHQQDFAVATATGYKMNEAAFMGPHAKQLNSGSLEYRYTPDPNIVQLKLTAKSGVDIIRPLTIPGHGAGSNVKKRIVVALYNYTAREDTDVSFQKGDRMEVLDDTESDWWRVIHLTTRKEGLIPWNFVAEERSVNSEE